MEAPEKIYLYPSDKASEEYEDEWGTKPWGEDYIEYTRTDAFIEKACDWLKNNLPIAMVRSDCYMFNGEFIEDFKKAMKDE